MRSFATALAAALCAVLLVIGIPACATGGAKRGSSSNPSAPTSKEYGELFRGHKLKDTKVLGAANDIDQLVEGTEQEASVKAKTDEQRAAVAAAPAEQIEQMNLRWERAIAGWESLAKVKDAKIAEQAEQIAALKDAELRAQVRSIRLFGLGCLVVAGLLGFVVKNLPGAFVAALFGFGALAVAQAWLRVASHPAFIPTVVCAIVAGLGGLTWACVHAYRKGDLARKTEREAARLRDTLGKVVPVLDAAYESAEGHAKSLLDRSVFDRLSSIFGKEEKAVVHEIRAAQASK